MIEGKRGEHIPIYEATGKHPVTMLKEFYCNVTGKIMITISCFIPI